MRAILLPLLTGAAAVTPPPAAAPSATDLPPYAAQLAQSPMITGGNAWAGDTGQAIWADLATATPDKRQATRWRYVRALIGDARGAEALGVLDVMLGDDKDLAMVAQWQLARAAALTLIGRDTDAVAALADPSLASNPEACAWRLRALADAGVNDAAVAAVNCALPAINGRPGEDRAPFVLAAARAAIETGKPAPALEWLKLFSDFNAEANLLRGRALYATGQGEPAALRLERAALGGDPELAAEARLAGIEARLAAHTLSPEDAYSQLAALRYGWRGGAVEERALRIQFRLATAAHDLRAQLRTGATLFRYFKLGAEAAPMMTGLQAQIAAALSPASGMPLADAAGLYWDYRELAPGGAEGDRLALDLAERLRAAGLYARAAELLQYQLTARAQDVAQGPLSAKVAALYILAGDPQKALDTIRTTEQPSYSDAMRQDRKRMEAVALHRLGKDDAAMAALDGLPDGEAIKAEIYWRAKNWQSFASMNQARLPAPARLDAAGQAIVLRQAVALGMLAREPQLQGLRTRYAAAFRKLPTAKAFEILTGAPGTVDAAAIAPAMAAIPDASPTGTIGDLLDAG